MNIYLVVVMGRIILSWFQGSFHRYPFFYNLFRFCHTLTEPLIAPLRRIIPPVRAGMGFVDFSALILLLLLSLARKLIFGLFF
ncbi:MAG: YggT family protein [Firmicutes bacterium]|nr:YggT family protein [Bacillota bacterium]